MENFATSHADMALAANLTTQLLFTYEGRAYAEDALTWREDRSAPDANILILRKTARIGGMTVEIERALYRDFPVAECVARFTGDGGMLEDARIQADMAGKAPVLMHGNGDTCGEDGYTFFEDALDHAMRLAPEDGTPCKGAFPYMRLRFAGHCVNAAIGWPAMWEATVSPSTRGASLTVRQRRCRMRVLPGETMRTPRLTLMAVSGDESRARNLWRRWYLAHILPRPNGRALPPKLCMHTFMVEGLPEFTGVTEQNQLEGIQKYIDRGLRPDVWWIDAGWYPCAFEWPNTGTWMPNPPRLPHGFAPIGEKCDENGMELLLWFEPERVRRGSALDRAHPEWLLRARNADGSDDENRLLNLGDDACRKWLTARVSDIIREGHVRVYRQDFNFPPRRIWEQNEADDRIGALENLHVQGYLRYWDDLVSLHPGLWIDSCASGGRRNDLETMRRAVPLHYTDVGYGNHPIKQKQHREMFEWIPYFRAHTMSWDRPDGSYHNGEDAPLDEFAYQCAMAPAVTFMVSCDADSAQAALARRMERVWRRAADIMLRGDYFPLSECRADARDYYAMQFDDPARGEGFWQIVRNVRCEADAYTAYPSVDPAQTYYLENPVSGETMVLSGAALAQGFTRALPPRSGEIWFYKRS